MSELCGVWMSVGAYETTCAEPIDHDGPCRPSMSELLQHLRALGHEQADIAAYLLFELDPIVARMVEAS